MRGFRFYAQLPEDRGSKSGSKSGKPFTRRYLEQLAADGHHNNVLALRVDDRGAPVWRTDRMGMNAIAALRDFQNSPVGDDANPTDEYLRKRCVRVDAGLAECLHPNLFSYLATLDPHAAI
jgi:hypothetical protein